MPNNMPRVIGVLAALAAPLFQVIGFVVWDGSWTGSAFALNLFKCTFASTGFLIVSAITRTVDPRSSDPLNTEVVGYLFLSSFLGIVIGDLMWLQALRLLHSTRVIVVDALKPFVAAILSWVFLEQELDEFTWAGMVCTMGGVLWVSLEHEKMKGTPEEEDEAAGHDSVPSVHDLTAAGGATSCQEDTQQAADSAGLPVMASVVCASRQMATGYCCAVGNVVLDSVGLVITRQHGVGLTTWEINLVRFGFAGVVMLCVSLTLHIWHCLVARGRQRQKQEGMQEAFISYQVDKVAWYALPHMTRRSWTLTSCGVVFVTFLCPALSQFALFLISVALCATLVSVGPLYVIPVAWLMLQKQPTVRGCLGACLTVGGIVLLSFSSR